MERFNASLNNKNKIVRAPLWGFGDHVRVRALGVLHPKEFESQFGPLEHSSDWHNITDLDLEYNVPYQMRDLERSIRKHGVLRPVIARQTPENFPEWRHHDRNSGENPPFIRKFPVIDGHHRAVAAMRVGARIPVYLTAETRTINRIRPEEPVGRVDLETPTAAQFRDRISEFRRSID